MACGFNITAEDVEDNADVIDQAVCIETIYNRALWKQLHDKDAKEPSKEIQFLLKRIQYIHQNGWTSKLKEINSEPEFQLIVFMPKAVFADLNQLSQIGENEFCKNNIDTNTNPGSNEEGPVINLDDALYDEHIEKTVNNVNDASDEDNSLTLEQRTNNDMHATTKKRTLDSKSKVCDQISTGIEKK